MAHFDRFLKFYLPSYSAPPSWGNWSYIHLWLILNRAARPKAGYNIQQQMVPRSPDSIFPRHLAQLNTASEQHPTFHLCGLCTYNIKSRQNSRGTPHWSSKKLYPFSFLWHYFLIFVRYDTTIIALSSVTNKLFGWAIHSRNGLDSSTINLKRKNN